MKPIFDTNLRNLLMHPYAFVYKWNSFTFLQYYMIRSWSSGNAIRAAGNSNFWGVL